MIAFPGNSFATHAPHLAISVVLATRNPRPEIFRRTLDALAAQDLPPHRWELIIVDNASRPPVSALAVPGSLRRARLLVSSRPGKAHALARGIRSSRAPLVLVVDDDNELHPSYLSEGLAIFAERPGLGACGGQLIPRFEAAPPPALVPHLHMLAIVQLDTAREAGDGSVMPPGAGCFFRRELACRWAHLFQRDAIRQECGSRLSGRITLQEDTDMCLVVLAHHYALGQFPQLSLSHLIGAERTQLDYLLKLSRSNGAGTLLTRWLWDGKNPARALWRECLHYCRLWRLPPLQRRFALAYWRGERAARAFIARHRGYRPLAS